jgi:hypothetical protein
MSVATFIDESISSLFAQTAYDGIHHTYSLVRRSGTSSFLAPVDRLGVGEQNIDWHYRKRQQAYDFQSNTKEQEKSREHVRSSTIMMYTVPALVTNTIASTDSF